MNAKHTPGPWILEAGRNIKTEDGEFYLSYGKDKHGNPLFRDFCALDRNARLIAAAPDLLAALESALKIVDAYRRISGGDGDLTALNARAAIAKAKGESC